MASEPAHPRAPSPAQMGAASPNPLWWVVMVANRACLAVHLVKSHRGSAPAALSSHPRVCRFSWLDVLAYQVLTSCCVCHGGATALDAL